MPDPLTERQAKTLHVTARQVRVLRFIAAYNAAHDQPPASSEIAEELGTKRQTADRLRISPIAITEK